VDIIGIKPAPSDHESNFKKVGAIPREPVEEMKIWMLFKIGVGGRKGGILRHRNATNR
jgi:hypothetical protein